MPTVEQARAELAQHQPRNPLWFVPGVHTTCRECGARYGPCPAARGAALMVAQIQSTGFQDLLDV